MEVKNELGLIGTIDDDDECDGNVTEEGSDDEVTVNRSARVNVETGTTKYRTQSDPQWDPCGRNRTQCDLVRL